MPSNHLICWRPLLLLPSIFPSIRVFSNESVLCIRWPKYWSFSFNISPSMNIQDWFSLRWKLVVSPRYPRDSQESSPTPKFKASILPRSAFFILQLSHSYMTTEKTIALTSKTFVSQVMSLLFKMLSKMEKEMTTHSSTLAWEIPCIEEPGRLQSMGSQRVGHNWATSRHIKSALYLGYVIRSMSREFVCLPKRAEYVFSCLESLELLSY